MVASGDYGDDELRGRLDKLEVLATLAFLGSRDDIDDESLYFLRNYLFDKPGPGRGRRQAALEDMLEHLMFRERPRRAMLREEISSVQGNQKELADQVDIRILEVTRRLEEMSASLSIAEHNLKTLSADTHAWLSFQSLGLASEEIRLARIVPLRVYLSEVVGNTVDEVSHAIQDVLDAFGLELADEFPAIKGSWFKKWFAKTAQAMTQSEVTDRLKKLERAVELKGLGQPQAEIDEKQASAAAKLMDALKDTPNAAIQVGSILLIKRLTESGSTMQIRTLTPTELMHLENNQALLMSPENILQRLSDACRSSNQKTEIDSIVNWNGSVKENGENPILNYTNLPIGLGPLDHGPKLLKHNPNESQEQNKQP